MPKAKPTPLSDNLLPIAKGAGSAGTGAGEATARAGGGSGGDDLPHPAGGS
jgi:hypothetical protein